MAMLLASRADAMVSPSNASTERPSKVKLMGRARSIALPPRSRRRAVMAAPVQEIRGFMHGMGDGVALHAKNLAACHVHPDLACPAFAIVAEIEILRPVCRADGFGAFRTQIAEITAEMKLGFAARTTEGAGKKLHDRVPQ